MFFKPYLINTAITHLAKKPKKVGITWADWRIHKNCLILWV